MISIPIYNTLGQRKGAINYDYNDDVKDITGRLIVYPDRVYTSEVNGLTLSKLFYKTKGGVVVEQNWFDKVGLYRKINNLFIPKIEALQAIDERLKQLQITGIKAKYHFQSLATGDEAEQLFKLITFIATSNDPTVSRVVDTYSNSMKKDWKFGFREMLIRLEEEAQSLLLRKVELMQEPIEVKTKLESKIENLKTVKQESNNDRTFEIVFWGFVILVVIKRLRKA